MFVWIVISSTHRNSYNFGHGTIEGLVSSNSQVNQEHCQISVEDSHFSVYRSFCAPLVKDWIYRSISLSAEVANFLCSCVAISASFQAIVQYPKMHKAIFKVPLGIYSEGNEKASGSRCFVSTWRACSPGQKDIVCGWWRWFNWATIEWESWASLSIP